MSYEFANWKPEQKEAHRFRLEESLLLPHGEERKQQLTRELAHLLFEMDGLADIAQGAEDE